MQNDNTNKNTAKTDEKKGLSNFAVRTLTTVIGGAIMAGLIIAGGWVLFGLLLILSLIGYYEMVRAMKVCGGIKSENSLTIVGYISVVLWCFSYKLFDYSYIAFLALVIAFLAHLTVYVVTFPKYKSGDIAGSFFSVLYLPVLISFLYHIRALDHGLSYVWMVPICSWVCDICAYLVGVKFGKHKMSPKLSPKKSIEGAIGGVTGTAIVSGLYAAFVIAPQMDKPVWTVVVVFTVMSVAGAFISMIGDLAASAIKRDNDIKDYGNIVPGHGGVMDRFDSFIFVAPLVYIACMIIQKL